MSLLICNVGTRDLVCETFPKDASGERAWAAAALARYAELRPHFRLPIIGKALNYLADHGIALEALVLVASDQPDTPGAPGFHASDTRPTAELIARLIADGYAGLPPLAAERISVWTISDDRGVGRDPSDYDQVLAFLERRLAELAQHYARGPAFLEVAGGTPAMTTGLLIAGTEAFGARAEVLSVHPQRPRPSALGTGRRLLAAPLRAVVRSNAWTYAYDAALRTFREQREAITDRLAPEAGATIEALLRYAAARYNFDFPGARAALEGLPAGGPWRDELAALQRQVTDPDRLDLLAEVIHGAEARYASGLYADFLTQVVRFEENLLRLLCLRRGVRFARREDGAADDDGSLISRAWLRAQPFRLANDYDDGRDLPTSRARMRELLGQMATGAEMNDLLNAIDRLRPLVYLRNDITHSLNGLRKADLAARFAQRRQAPEGEADQIVPHLAGLYARVAGRSLPPSPYQAINALLDRLLQPGPRP